MAKSPEAFRTISEVADWLGTPAHVLRFWESRFSQVKPVKRAGGRRYYRPNDMALLGGIKKLLHDEGMTIRGVQKLLRENGVKYVAALSDPFDADTDTDTDNAPDIELEAAQEVPLTSEPEAADEAPIHLDVAAEETEVVSIVDHVGTSDTATDTTETLSGEDADLLSDETDSDAEVDAPETVEPTVEDTEALFAESLDAESTDEGDDGFDVEPFRPAFDRLLALRDSMAREP